MSKCKQSEMGYSTQCCCWEQREVTFPAGSPASDSSLLLRDLQVTAGPRNSPAHFQFKLPLCQVFVLLEVPWGFWLGLRC